MVSIPERTLASEILADAYLQANRVDDAFQTIALLPNADALDFRLLVRLVSAGAEEARHRNLKHLVVSQKYGDLAIRAIEASSGAGGMNAAAWAAYKSETLPSLYQTLGVFFMHAGEPTDGKAYLQKAVQLKPYDPMNHILLGAAANGEYSVALQQMKQLRPGPARDALGKKIIELVNQVVDSYAHGLALSAGSPQEQTVRAQVWPDLESYYKFLHKGSLDGLQALIDQYKKQ